MNNNLILLLVTAAGACVAVVVLAPWWHLRRAAEAARVARHRDLRRQLYVQAATYASNVEAITRFYESRESRSCHPFTVDGVATPDEITGQMQLIGAVEVDTAWRSLLDAVENLSHALYHTRAYPRDEVDFYIPRDDPLTAATRAALRELHFQMRLDLGYPPRVTQPLARRLRTWWLPGKPPPPPEQDVYDVLI